MNNPWRDISPSGSFARPTILERLIKYPRANGISQRSLTAIFMHFKMIYHVMIRGMRRIRSCFSLLFSRSWRFSWIIEAFHPDCTRKSQMSDDYFRRSGQTKEKKFVRLSGDPYQKKKSVFDRHWMSEFNIVITINFSEKMN